MNENGRLGKRLSLSVVVSAVTQWWNSSCSTKASLSSWKAYRLYSVESMKFSQPLGKVKRLSLLYWSCVGIKIFIAELELEQYTVLFQTCVS